jgi:hypothetical protein
VEEAVNADLIAGLALLREIVAAAPMARIVWQPEGRDDEAARIGCHARYEDGGFESVEDEGVLPQWFARFVATFDREMCAALLDVAEEARALHVPTGFALHDALNRLSAVLEARKP